MKLPQKLTTTSIQCAPCTSYIGIDVSKDALDIYGIPGLTQTSNNSVGHRQIIHRAPKNCHIILEATGGYEKTLWLYLLEKNITISRINPTRIRDLAKSVGQLTKTDAIDAKMIAFYGEKINPRPDTLPHEDRLKLESIVQTREQLVFTRSIQFTQIKQHADKGVIKIFSQLIAHLDKQIGKLDQQIKKLLVNSIHHTQATRLQKISGVGPITVATLFAYMPELGQLTANQAASLAGLAPHNRDSASSNKKRHIQGGRARIRKILYMSATSAIRFNTILKAFYERLVAKGKAHKVAMVAVMRKLIILINRLMKDENFSPA